MKPIEVRRTDILDLQPVDRGEFFAIVGPCLALTGGVGMSAQDQEAWLEAAFTALGDMPIRLLERGAQAAMETADHPSKIVPAIIKATKDDLAWRRKMQTVPSHTKPEPVKVISEAERVAVAAEMRALIKSMEARQSAA